MTVDLAGTTVTDLWPDATRPSISTETIREGVDKNGRRDRSIRAIDRPTLTYFPPLPATTQPTPAVIVIPGGGYGGEVVDREGYFVADQLRAHGIAAFVLKYRLPNHVAPGADTLPLPILDVQRAIRLVRTDAAAFGVDPQRVGVMGFSAGGHVAGMAATLFDAGNASAVDPIERVASRPDFAVLMYAVSSMHDPLAHVGSRRALLGDSPTEGEMDRFSTAQHVTSKTPPLLLVHARDDGVVKYQNSVVVAEAARRVGVPCEFITFATGGHGFGIAAPGTEPDGWLDRFYAWLATTAAK